MPEFESPFESMIWRIVFEQVATLEEIDRSWSMVDVLNAVWILDYRLETEKRRMKKNG